MAEVSDTGQHRPRRGGVRVRPVARGEEAQDPDRPGHLRGDQPVPVVVWAVTGFGYFWPGWVMAGWGVLLGLDVWSAYSRRPITDDDIERELHTGR